MKRIFLILAILLVIVLTIRLAAKNYISVKSIEVLKEATSTASVIPPKEEISRVARVIDGDTIVLDTGQKVRYIGMDTPEIETNACYSREASQENKKLVEGKSVRLVGDVSETDKFNRLLRYVYTGDIFVNDMLVRQGYARAEPVKPDVQFAKLFLAAQDEARENNKGLWGKCQ